MQKKIEKLYYSISEVSEITGLKQYVLRYWESEFEDLAPPKNRAGNRIYTQENIDKILLIKKLLYDEKYTIEGAKKKLQDLSHYETENTEQIIKIINEIRNELNCILQETENKKDKT